MTSLMTPLLANFAYFLKQEPFLLAVFAGMLGLMVGSFLNVVIYRAPIMIKRSIDNSVAVKKGVPLPFTDTFNLAVPRSACPQCGHKITAIENIPVVSYLFLKGRCRGCKSPISMRYPFIELLTAILSFVAIFLFGASFLGFLVMCCIWIAIALVAICHDKEIGV